MHLTNNKTHVFCVMKRLPNFRLTNQSAIERFLSSKGITDFHSATRYLKQLPTTLESESHDLTRVVKEGGSRCSKIAILAALARENYHPSVKLALCTFTESYENNPLIQCLLEKYKLPSLPETACFLKYHDEFYSPLNHRPVNSSSIQSDIEITPMQIGSFTRRYCHHFIKHWLFLEKLHRTWTVEKICRIKQECYQVLETQAWQSDQTSYRE